MPYLYVGARGKIAVIEGGTGKTVKEIILNPSWLKTGNGFVNMIKAGNCIYAHTYGRLYCVDAGSGRVLWSNALKGMGYDLTSLISDDDNNARGNMLASKLTGMENRRRSSD